MIFTTMIEALAAPAETTINLFDHNGSGKDEEFSVTHDYTMCQIKYNLGFAVLSCGTPEKVNQIQINGNNLPLMAPLIPNGDGSYQLMDKRYLPASLDFKGNSICVVDKKGNLACGTQNKSLSKTETISLTLIEAAVLVSEIRFSPSESFMCITGFTRTGQKEVTPTDIYCTTLGVKFLEKTKWTQMANLKDVNSIILTPDNEVCGRKTFDDKVYCINIDGTVEESAGAKSYQLK
eukprot:NODE_614_length_5380_cov_0.964022.p5 type:complete len:235 gc:universal NODE_614_length_5380_cov_0.964022:1301-2005(+)